MSTKTMRRKLTAILAADAVGYSRMISDNEERALRVLASHRAIIDPIIASREGRIVSTAGDSVLADFPSSVEAVRCAIEIQEALQTRNESLPREERMFFRIGINLGDVVIKGDDILGDGVNVAARLESISEPGGICISSSVFDQVNGKMNLGFVDIGEQQLKNINRPIRVYRLGGASPATASPPSLATPGRLINKIAMGAGVTTLVVMLLIAGRWSANQENPAVTATDRQVPQPVTQALPQTPPQSPSTAAPTGPRAAPKAPVPQANVAHPAVAPVPTPVPAAIPETPSPQKLWSAMAHCKPFLRQPAIDFPLELRREGRRIVVERYIPGENGEIKLAGMPSPQGHLVLNGEYIVQKTGRRLPARFEGTDTGNRITLIGKLGPRECAIDMVRAP